MHSDNRNVRQQAHTKTELLENVCVCINDEYEYNLMYGDVGQRRLSVSVGSVTTVAPNRVDGSAPPW